LKTDFKNESSGYYEGSYYLLSEKDTLLGGNVLGTIDYQGTTKFELAGVTDFRFIKGHVITNKKRIEMYSDLLDLEERVISPLDGSLNHQDSVITGTLEITSANYSHLQIQLTRKPL
jgi:hypothetical protein